MDYRNAFDLTGSVAVVTGGSSGIVANFGVSDRRFRFKPAGGFG